MLKAGMTQPMKLSMNAAGSMHAQPQLLYGVISVVVTSQIDMFDV